MTPPYSDSTIQAGGVPVPEDQPGRVKIDDQTLKEVASSASGVVVYRLGQLVTPQGHYQQDLDGVDVRCEDGVHFSAVVGQVLAPDILPVLSRLGRTTHVSAPADALALPPSIPGW